MSADWQYAALGIGALLLVGVAVLAPRAEPRERLSLGRVHFANALRGVAALLVVFFHYFGIFWLLRPTIARLTNAPELPASIATPAVYEILNTVPQVNWGRLGVGLFFVVSGFVVPFSLIGYSRAGFAVGRIFRLWPTYAVGFSLTLVAIWLSGGAIPYPPSSVGVHYVPGLRDLTGAPGIDGLVWTLEIEVKFYVVAALVAAGLRSGSLLVFLVPLAWCVGAHFLQPADFAIPALYATWFDAPYIALMFGGVALHYAHRGIVGRPVALLLCLGLMAVAAPGFTGQAGQFFVSYLLALALFVTVMFWPRELPDRGLLAWAADISYPLYVVHGVAGYALMFWLIGLGVTPWLVPFIALAAALCTATLLHYLVEAPTHRIGQRLAHRLSRAGEPAAHNPRRLPPAAAPN